MVNLRTTINVYNAFNVGYTALIKYNGDVLVSIKQFRMVLNLSFLLCYNYRQE